MGKFNWKRAVIPGYALYHDIKDGQYFRPMWSSLFFDNDKVDSLPDDIGVSSASTFNAIEAEKNRQFQLDTRATQYQSTVADMKAAGLSPAAMLSSGAGASVASSGTSAYADESMKVAKLQAVSAANVARIQADATKYAANAQLAGSIASSAGGYYGRLNSAKLNLLGRSRS